MKDMLAFLGAIGLVLGLLVVLPWFSEQFFRLWGRRHVHGVAKPHSPAATLTLGGRQPVGWLAEGLRILPDAEHPETIRLLVDRLIAPRALMKLLFERCGDLQAAPSQVLTVDDGTRIVDYHAPVLTYVGLVESGEGMEVAHDVQFLARCP
jgi:hypothetical protein